MVFLSAPAPTSNLQDEPERQATSPPRVEHIRYAFVPVSNKLIDTRRKTMSQDDYYRMLAEQAMQQNVNNANQRFAGLANGFASRMGNAQYFSTNNMYRGVPRGSGILAFNQLPGMQWHRQRMSAPFAYQYESGRHGKSLRNMNSIMQPVGGPFNGQVFGPAVANSGAGIYTVTRRPTPCDICGLVYSSLSNLRDHRRLIHGC